MRGIILTVDRRNGRGLLRAEDGRRYGFDLADWRDDARPAKGDEVDFELHGGTPRELLLLNAAEAGEGASQLAAIAQRIRERPILVWAGALILASLLPAYGFAGRPGSLFAVQAHISSLAGEIDRLWAAAGASPDIAARVGIAKLLLAILPVTLAAPLLSCLVFWRTLNEQDDRPLARITGLAAAILTAGLPLLYGLCAWLLLSGELGRGAREILSGGPFAIGGLGMLRFIDIGTVAVSVSGFMLWRAASGGRLLPQPRAAVPRHDDPATFAPSQAVRQMKSNPEAEGDDPIPAQFRRNARARGQGDEAPRSAVTEMLPAHMLPPEPRGPASIGAGAIPWPPPESDAPDPGVGGYEADPLSDVGAPEPDLPPPPLTPVAIEPVPVANGSDRSEERRRRDDLELGEPRIARPAGPPPQPAPPRPEPERRAGQEQKKAQPQPVERVRAPVREAPAQRAPHAAAPTVAAPPSSPERPPAAPPSSPPAAPQPSGHPKGAEPMKNEGVKAPPAEPVKTETPPAPVVQESNESVQRLYERLRAERLLRMTMDRDESQN